MKKVNLPVALLGIIFPRSILFRSDLWLFNSVAQPGCIGELTFGICNLGKDDIKISFGARRERQSISGSDGQYPWLNFTDDFLLNLPDKQKKFLYLERN